MAGRPARACGRRPSVASRPARPHRRRSRAAPRQERRAWQHEHRRQREAIDFLRSPQPGGRGRLRKVTPKALTKQAAASAADSASSAPIAGTMNFSAPLRQRRADQNRLEGQPFRNEAVERRQRRDRDATDQEQRTVVTGMRWIKPAEMLHVALAGGGQHRAGAEEQQALEERVVEDVEQRRGDGERGAGASCRSPGTPAPGRGR